LIWVFLRVAGNDGLGGTLRETSRNCEANTAGEGGIVHQSRNDLGVLAATWTPDPTLTAEDGFVASEFLWSALDSPTEYASFTIGRAVDPTGASVFEGFLSLLHEVAIAKSTGVASTRSASLRTTTGGH
jgi:hypothetical protein